MKNSDFLKIFIFISFLIVLLCGIIRPWPVNQAIRLGKSLFSSTDVSTFERCELPVAPEIPHNAVVFIGHAYGSSSGTHDFLSPNVLRFIELNRSVVSALIFTGDVFFNPSIEKWHDLANFVAPAELYIAPGNHDVMSNAAESVFIHSPFHRFIDPYLVQIDELEVLVDNSIKSAWQFSGESELLTTQIESSKIIISRHNPPISELQSLANSQAGMSPTLESASNLQSRLNDRYYTWILGDFGAHPSSDRIGCYVYQNHRFILSGIGGYPGDTVVIFSDGHLYQFEI